MFGWVKALAVKLSFVRQRALSLIANWLQGVLWLIETGYLSIAKQAYGGNAVAYSCVRLLATSIPEAPIISYTEDSKGERLELPPDHPLVQLIRHPNELMTEYEFMELVTIHVACAGHAFWWKQRSNGGQVIALWPLRPDRVGPIWSDTLDKPGQRLLAGWSYQDPGTGAYIPLARRDVLSFNLPDPAGEAGGIVEGLGPLQVLASEISADNEATAFVGALLKNYAAPSLLLRLKGTVRSEEEANLIKAKARAEFSGSKRGDIGIVDADSEVEMIGFNLQQLEFPDLRAVAESRIAAAVGVPAILVGLKTGLDRSTFSNFGTARQFFAETTLSAYWRRYADQLTNDLAAEFDPGIICEFDTSKVRALAGQRLEDLVPLKEAFAAGAATRNEYRDKLGLDPDPNGDVYVVPASTIEVPKLDHLRPAFSPPPPPEPSAPPPADGQEGQPRDDDTEEEQESAAARAAGMPALRAGDAPTELRLAADSNNLPELDPDESRLSIALEAVFSELSELAVESVVDGVPLTDEQMEAVLRRALIKELTTIATESLLGVSASLGVQYDVAAVNNLAAGWAREYSYELVKGITATTRRTIADAVSSFAANPSMGIDEVAELLRPAFGDVRSRMIAITETTRARSAGTNLYQKQVAATHNLTYERVWFTQADERVCPACGPLDSQPESVWAGDYPDGPPAHVRCRCALLLRPVKKGKQP